MNSVLESYILNLKFAIVYFAGSQADFSILFSFICNILQFFNYFLIIAIDVDWKRWIFVIQAHLGQSDAPELEQSRGASSVRQVR